jgi:hypothetical protein
MMEDWDFEGLWEWDAEEDYEDLLQEVAHVLADSFFLSDNDFLPNVGEDYNLGHLSAEAWWPLVNQLDEMVDLETIVELADALDDLLGLPGVPTELLEDPHAFLESILVGSLPPEPSGRRVGSRKLVKIALVVVRLLEKFPKAAQSAVRAWASVHRSMMASYAFDRFEEEDLSDLLFAPDLPPAMAGFSMMIALTMMRWPDRAEGLPMPPGFSDPELYEDALAQWEALPDHPVATVEGEGEAEALFAQGQLAHMLAQLGSEELMPPDGVGDEEIALAYSRLSRAILWVHNQCRRCPERDEVACKVASNWPERPAPLLDVASEIANTGRIVGCISA